MCLESVCVCVCLGSVYVCLRGGVYLGLVVHRLSVKALCYGPGAVGRDVWG